jgi:DNA-binding CsgD family transcriptional regulator
VNGSPGKLAFVGRDNELRQLRAAFEDAATGHGALVMLVGEPGIGKTALCDQLASLVAVSGGRTLVGHCYEEGSFRPPYQPFVEVFSAYIQDCDVGLLSAELPDLARAVPLLRERYGVTPRPPGDPEEDRWRLLQAATDLLHHAAEQQPLLVVVEDLHDADRGTLDLLLYLARNLHDTRLLVVGTYRDVAVDRGHPLAAALTELHRASNVARIHLIGLSTDEVLRLMAETSQQRVSTPFAELVHHQTEGNPLFVHEVLRFVIEEGLLEGRDRALRRVGHESLAGRMPEGLRDAVGKRLSRLSEGTNRVLRVASVIGREFELEVLRLVLAQPEEDLETALEEATTTAIIEEHSVVGSTIKYRFSHAFFRQTLYDEIVAPRRIRLHQQVARALEEVYARRLDEHAGALAEHFAFSSDAQDLAKAVHYGELAAERANEAFAYGEAARYLERALVVQDLVNPEDSAKCCDLLLGMGQALLPVGEAERVITHVAPDALAFAERLGDGRRAFRACHLVLDGFMAQGAISRAASPEYLRWAQLARGYANPESIERVHADLALALAQRPLARLRQAVDLQLDALALARRLDDPEAMFRAARRVMGHSAPEHWGERLRLAEEFATRSRDGVSSRTLGLVLWQSGSLQLANGDRAAAEELWRQIRELSARTHAATLPLMVGQCEIVLAIIEGHLDEALVLLQRFVERAEDTGAGVRARLFSLLLLVSPVVYLGRPAIYLTAFDQYSELAGAARARAPFQSIGPRAWCLAQLGRAAEARALAGPMLDGYANLTADDERGQEHLILYLQLAVLLGYREAAQAISRRLECVAHVCACDYMPACVSRILGDAAIFLEDWAAARRYYAQALETAAKIGFRPELALTHVGLAELLVEDSDGDVGWAEALQHLDIAIPELEDMHMQPALQHALAIRDTCAARQRLLARTPTAETLTAREREIARLVADGLSNRDIAERLVIAEGTVEVHVKHILSKLDFRSRAQVAAWAAKEAL